MTVFDTDILSLVFRGNLSYQQRFNTVVAAERYVSVVNCEEVYRGRLNGIRKADTGKNLTELITAYDESRVTVSQLGKLRVLHYNLVAHNLFT